MTTERLSGLDASFLYMETPTLHMHVAMTVGLRPVDRPGRLLVPAAAPADQRPAPLAPVFTRRLVEVPFRLGHPIWVDDPDFDIDNHLRRAALPSPGGMRELAEFAADVDSRQLHRDRPLWEMWIVEGLESGKIALVAKMHHSTVDGVSGAELLGVLFDLEPDPAVAARGPRARRRRAHPLGLRARLPGHGGPVAQALRDHPHALADRPVDPRRAPVSAWAHRRRAACPSPPRGPRSTWPSPGGAGWPSPPSASPTSSG